MSTAIKFRGGTTAQHSTFTGAAREITVDTTKNAVVVHDGTTPGGTTMAREAVVGARKASVVAGTVDAITATFDPAFSSLANCAGYILAVPMAGANTSTTPTLAIDGLTAKTIVKGSNATLGVGDIPGTDFVGLFAYDVSMDKFQLLNPYQSASASSGIGFKNKIIGGDFTLNPWQRGTTFTALSGYGPDRFVCSNATGGVVDVLKTADAPTVAQAGMFTQHCLHADVTTADAAVAAGDIYLISQRVEGLNIAPLGFGQAGTRYVTLSFWVKSTKTGVFCVGLQNSAGTRSYVAEYTVSASDTWEKKVITVPVDTSGTWLYDTGVGLRVTWTLMAGSTYQGSANTWSASDIRATANQVNALDNVVNNFKLALIQLESGQTATAFDERNADYEFGLCEDYYKRWGFATNVIQLRAYAAAAAGISQTLAHKKMRASPTLTKVGTWSVSNCAQPVVQGSNGVVLILATTTIAGDTYFSTLDSTCGIILDAEL